MSVNRFLPDEEIVRLAQEGYVLTEAEIVRLGHLVDGAERRGAVKALRKLAANARTASGDSCVIGPAGLRQRADAIEAGADL